MTIDQINTEFYSILKKLSQLNLHCGFSVNHASIYLIGDDYTVEIKFEENDDNNIIKVQELFKWSNNPTFEGFENIYKKYN